MNSNGKATLCVLNFAKQERQKVFLLPRRVAESEVKYPTPTFPKFPTPTP